MAELVGSILDVIKCIGRPTTKYLKYQRKFTLYVDDLKQAQADMHAKEADIQQQLKDELHLGKRPKQEVERWLKKVEEKLFHAQCVEDKVRKGKYLFRSCLGKLVDEATRALKQVCDDGHFSGSLVVNDPSTGAINLPTPELVGEIDVREEIYRYLMGDEVGMIGVCGMGGIGKTTLMKDVHNRLLKESKFRKLIWVTVSQDFDIRRLQKNIACQLMENLSEDEDTIIRAGKLLEMLREQGSYVLVLDDVWKSFSLGDVGVLEPTAENGCKLVLTTRSERVVRSMGFKKVQVACLSLEASMNLFLSKVGQDILPNPTLESHMKLVVRECDGLPLAIVTLAGCMRGISDPRVWENAIDELRGYVRNIHDMEEKVYGCLKFSYDHLEQMDQDCFLYCALYPEDDEIDKDEIIEFWMDEGLIGEMGSRKAMERSGHSILQKLQENCLLERVEGDMHVKMHDLVRDMALHITKGRFLVKADMELKELPNEEEWSEDLEKVSLMFNSFSTIPRDMKSPKLPRLTTLLLSRSSLKEIPESFFEHFPNLKILDLSRNPLESLPCSISSLQKLVVLLLYRCHKLESLPCVSKLQGLKKLNLRGSGVKEIPQGLEMLVNLRYLNLGETRLLKEIPDGLLSKLRRLQFLTIHSMLNAEEMLELNKLEVVEGCFSNVGDLSMYVGGKREMLHKYSIFVCPKLYELKQYNPWGSSKLVTFKGIDFENDAIMLPCCIQHLHLKYCGGVRSLNDVGFRDATDLKGCEVEFCFGLESIFFSSKCTQLQTLESLTLKSLANLKVIVGESSSVGTFSSLKQITICSCHKIKSLFSADWILHNLEEINVTYCLELEGILMESEKDIPRSNNDTIKYTFPKLRRLTLFHLPKLKSLCSENGVMVCGSLQFIEINYCPNVKRIPLYLPQLKVDNEGKLSRSNTLEEIRVRTTDWWESVVWDHPNVNVKNVVRPLLKSYVCDRGAWNWRQAM